MRSIVCLYVNCVYRWTCIFYVQYSGQPVFLSSSLPSFAFAVVPHAARSSWKSNKESQMGNQNKENEADRKSEKKKRESEYEKEKDARRLCRFSFKMV